MRQLRLHAQRQILERRIGGWVIRRRWRILTVAFFLTAGAGTGILRLQFDRDVDSFFPDENPQLQALQAFHRMFGKHETLVYAVAPKSGDSIFNAATLRVLVDLTEAVSEAPHVREVFSLTRHRTVRTDEESIRVEELITHPETLTEQELLTIRDIALNEHRLVRQVVSPEGNAAALLVSLDLPDGDSEAKANVVGQAYALRNTFRKHHPDLEFHLTGSLAVEDAFKAAGAQDLRTLAPIMFLVLFVFIALALRSATGMVATLIVMLATVVTSLGLIGWLGLPLSIVSAAAPGLIMTLAIADCVHIINAMFSRLRARTSRSAAIVQALRVNVQPVFLTSATTAVGFLSLTFSESPPFQHLGTMVTIGVLIAFAYSVFLLPALLSLLPVFKVPKTRNPITTAMHRLSGLVLHRERALRITLVSLSLLLVSGIRRIEITTNFFEFYSPKLEIRQASDFHLRHMGVYSFFSYAMDSGQPGGIAEPAYLNLLDRFSEWYRQQPGVIAAHSVSDMVRTMHRTLHENDPKKDRIPDTREAAAQYLLLLEMALPAGHRLDSDLDPTHSVTAFRVMTRRMTARELRALDHAAQQWLAAHAPPSFQGSAAGSSLVWAHLVQRSVMGMMRGTLGALVLISLALIGPFRSIRLGLLSLIPNLLPIGIAFGLWGFLSGSIGFAASIISAMCIGIVVDDTIHFLHRYSRARKQYGLNPEQAVRHTIESVGPALVTTSIALIGGFSVLAFSPFGMTSLIGQMCVVVIVLALAMDLLLLPTLLLALERKRPIA